MKHSVLNSEEDPFKRIRLRLPSRQGTDWSRSLPDFLSSLSPRGRSLRRAKNFLSSHSPRVRRAKKGKIKFEPRLLEIAPGIKKTLVPTRVKKDDKKKISKKKLHQKSNS